MLYPIVVTIDLYDFSHSPVPGTTSLHTVHVETNTKDNFISQYLISLPIFIHMFISVLFSLRFLFWAKLSSGLG